MADIALSAGASGEGSVVSSRSEVASAAIPFCPAGDGETIVRTLRVDFWTKKQINDAYK